MSNGKRSSYGTYINDKNNTQTTVETPTKRSSYGTITDTRLKVLSGQASIQDLFKEKRESFIGLDTLASDMSTLGKTVEGIYKGWQSKKTMDSTKPQVESMYNRLKVFQSYNKQFGDGSVDVSEQINAYKSVLDDWDEIAKGYGKYKNADEYNEAVKIDELEKMPSAEIKKQITSSKEIYETELAPLKAEYDKLNRDIRFYGRGDRSKLSTAKDYNNAKKRRDELKKQILALQSKNDIAYTALDGRNITWSSLYENKKAEEDFEKFQEAIKNKDFEEKSQKGLSRKNPSPNLTETIEKIDGKWYTTTGKFGKKKEIKNILTFVRDNADSVGNVRSTQDFQILLKATNNEVNLYSYLLEIDEKKAQRYLDLLMPTLLDRESDALKERIDIPVLKHALSVAQGTANYLDSIGIADYSDDATMIAMQKLQSEAKGLDKYLMSAGTTIGNQLPSILLSWVTSGIASGLGASEKVVSSVGRLTNAASVGISAKGSAYKQKIAEGWNPEDAQTYSTLVGISEATLESILSGIVGTTGIGPEDLLKKAGMIDNALLKFSAKSGISLASEELEEITQLYLEPTFEVIIKGGDYDQPTIDELVETAIVTAISTGFFNSPTSISKAVDDYKQTQLSKAIKINSQNKEYISLEEFSNSEAKVWKNVDYNDNDTKAALMQETHTRMVQEGLVVKVSEDTQSQVGESFPDLRSMKKKERTSILKESMDKLKTNLRQFLNGFKNQDFEFSVNGKVLEATLYNTGINEVLEKITQKKANMLYSTEEIFKNAQYLYSTTDYSGDPNVYRWNYFYTPVQIGEETVGVRIAVRDLAKQNESQIYNWGIKKDTSLDGVRDDKNRKSHGISSDVSNTKVPQKVPGVKTIISHSDQNNTQADPNGPANFMPEGESEGGRADGEIADFGGIDTARGKHLNKAQQDEITAIGEKLDRKVVYEDFYSLDKFKGKKKIPDGYLAKDGTVHINYYAKRPVYFLFKHEITHYLKRTLASYNDFMNLVIDSNAFKDWLDRNGYSSIDTLKTEIMDTYSEVEDFDESRCYDEILANFVGEYLFGGENAVSQKLINAFEPKQKKTFMDVMHDIISYFKSKFQKNKPIQTEIEKIENEFIKVYKEAVEVEVDEGSSQATEEMYSISKTTNNVPVIVVNDDILRNVINEKELIDIVKKSLGKFKRVPIKGQNIYFVSDTKNEYLNSKYSQYLKKNQKQTYYDKMRLSSHPQDIVYATTNYINEGLNHPRKDNIIDFARGNILVDISGRKYSAEVVIGFTKSGICELHDIVKMLPTSFEYKKEATSESMDSNESTRSDVTSINKIPHKEDSVNNNFMLDSEDYSIPSSTNVESLLKSYEKGEISRQEYLNALKKEKTLNPLEIANLSERDANTTPEHAKKTGESKGNGESNTYNSLLESDIFDDTFKKEMKESSFVKKYETVTNEETLKIAAKELDEGGLSYVNKWWNTKPERASLVDAAVGFILIDRYQRVGDYQSAVAAAEKVREFGTASGQQVQIFSVLGRLDPNTMVVYAQKELSKAFDEMVKTRTQKWIDKNADKFNLTDNELEFIRRRTLQAAKLPEGRDKAIKLAEIATLLQDKLPPQKGEGLKTLQRMSMLLNAKTNIRNITGNGVMVPVFIFSDFFGSGIDKWVSTKTGVRTTGNFDVKSAKGLKKGAFETMDDFRRHVNTRNSEMNRFEIGSGKAFDEHHDGKFAKQLDEVAKVLNALDRFTSFCLEMGDRPFYEMWFINSLNNQMKLNNVSEATSEMVAIASSEALQRTWQDTNKVVKAVAGTKNTLNYISIGGYGLGDVLIKFTKTPANLTKAIFDFSPAGLIKSIASDGLTLRNAVKKGSFKPKMQKQFVDSLSKGITGTLLYILAASLASAGVLGGGGDEDKDVSDFEKYIQGIPEYSFKFAGKWWSYEWMQPVGAIAATVTDYMKSKENNPDNNFFENTLEAIKAGGEVLYNQSFMKSIQNLFTADNIVDGLIDAILDDPSVYVPQLLSQVANVTDKYRRTTYEKNKPLENALNRVKVKIPGLRQTLPKSVDVLGREIPNSQKGIFNAFFNPANTFTDTSTPVTDHVYELYTKTKNKTLMPRVAPYSITIKGITKNFTPEEKNDFQRISGATASDILEIAFKSDGYKKLSDEQKVEFINDVYGFATKMAKSSIEYDYTTLSAMVGEYPDGKPILSESDYKKLPEEAREMLVQEYFFNKTEIRFLDDYKGLINHYINQATE